VAWCSWQRCRTYFWFGRYRHVCTWWPGSGQLCSVVCVIILLAILIENVVCSKWLNKGQQHWTGGGGTMRCLWLPGYSVPGKEAKSVCVCLFVHSHILGTSCPNLIKFSLDVACGCGLVFLCRRYDRLYTRTGFVGDDMFARNLSGKGDASRMPTHSESPGDRARWRISKLA